MDDGHCDAAPHREKLNMQIIRHSPARFGFGLCLFVLLRRYIPM